MLILDQKNNNTISQKKILRKKKEIHKLVRINDDKIYEMNLDYRHIHIYLCDDNDAK